MVVLQDNVECRVITVLVCPLMQLQHLPPPANVTIDSSIVFAVDEKETHEKRKSSAR